MPAPDEPEPVVTPDPDWFWVGAQVVFADSMEPFTICRIDPLQVTLSLGRDLMAFPRDTFFERWSRYVPSTVADPDWFRVGAHVTQLAHATGPIVERHIIERIFPSMIHLRHGDLITRWPRSTFFGVWVPIEFVGRTPQQNQQILRIEQLYPGSTFYFESAHRPTDGMFTVVQNRQRSEMDPMEVTFRNGNGERTTCPFPSHNFDDAFLLAEASPDHRYPVGTILGDENGTELRVCEVGEDYLITSDPEEALVPPCTGIERTFAITWELHDFFYIVPPGGQQSPQVPELPEPEPPRSRFDRAVELDDDSS